MKKLIVAVYWLFPLISSAQQFEGGIKWSFETEVQFADSSMQASAGASLNSMSKQAKVELLTRIKEGDLLIAKKIDKMTTLILYLKQKDRFYYLDRKDKQYSEIPVNPQIRSSESITSITKAPDATKILDFNCTKYVIQGKSNNVAMQASIWATTEIDIDKETARRLFDNFKQSALYDGVDGVPLRIEIRGAVKANGGVVMITKMEAIEIKREELNASEFKIPKSYKERPNTILLGGGN